MSHPPFVLRLDLVTNGETLSLIFPESKHNHALANIFLEAAAKPGSLSYLDPGKGRIIIRHTADKRITLQVPVALEASHLPRLEQIFDLLNHNPHTCQVIQGSQVILRLQPVPTPD